MIEADAVVAYAVQLIDAYSDSNDRVSIRLALTVVGAMAAARRIGGRGHRGRIIGHLSSAGIRMPYFAPVIITNRVVIACRIYYPISIVSARIESVHPDPYVLKLRASLERTIRELQRADELTSDMLYSCGVAYVRQLFWMKTDRMAELVLFVAEQAWGAQNVDMLSNCVEHVCTNGHSTNVIRIGERVFELGHIRPTVSAKCDHPMMVYKSEQFALNTSLQFAHALLSGAQDTSIDLLETAEGAIEITEFGVSMTDAVSTIWDRYMETMAESRKEKSRKDAVSGLRSHLLSFPKGPKLLSVCNALVEFMMSQWYPVDHTEGRNEISGALRVLENVGEPDNVTVDRVFRNDDPLRLQWEKALPHTKRRDKWKHRDYEDVTDRKPFNETLVRIGGMGADCQQVIELKRLSWQSRWSAWSGNEDDPRFRLSVPRVAMPGLRVLWWSFHGTPSMFTGDNFVLPMTMVTGVTPHASDAANDDVARRMTERRENERREMEEDRDYFVPAFGKTRREIEQVVEELRTDVFEREPEGRLAWKKFVRKKFEVVWEREHRDAIARIRRIERQREEERFQRDATALYSRAPLPTDFFGNVVTGPEALGVQGQLTDEEVQELEAWKMREDDMHRMRKREREEEGMDPVAFSVRHTMSMENRLFSEYVLGLPRYRSLEEDPWVYEVTVVGKTARDIRRLCSELPPGQDGECDITIPGLSNRLPIFFGRVRVPYGEKTSVWSLYEVRGKPVRIVLDLNPDHTILDMNPHHRGNVPTQGLDDEVYGEMFQHLSQQIEERRNMREQRMVDEEREERENEDRLEFEDIDS